MRRIWPMLLVIGLVAALPPEGGSHEAPVLPPQGGSCERPGKVQNSRGFRLQAEETSLRLPAEESGAHEIAREVYLMGTLATITTIDADRGRAIERLEALLRPLEQTEAQLSTWRADSEVSRLNASAGTGGFALSPSLCAVFREIDRWHAETGGAFDPAIGALASAWDLHGNGRLADAAEVANALQRTGWRRTGFDPVECTLRLPAGMTLDVGGFGKGEALDRARAALDDADAAWEIDLGGQVAVGGTLRAPGWPVAIAHPRRRDRPFLTCLMETGSLSTSGGSERDRRVRGRRVGHILDPRTGRPAPFRGSVTVWHERALAADVLSTALYVRGPDEGIQWADAHGIAALFLIPRAGDTVTTRASARWELEFGNW